MSTIRWQRSVNFKWVSTPGIDTLRDVPRYLGGTGGNAEQTERFSKSAHPDRDKRSQDRFYGGKRSYSEQRLRGAGPPEGGAYCSLVVYSGPRDVYALAPRCGSWGGAPRVCCRKRSCSIAGERHKLLAHNGLSHRVLSAFDGADAVARMVAESAPPA
jgi:hypothetical protein